MAHTYGPTCRLARAPTFSGSKGDIDRPPIKAQFFYSSAQPIDDPLSSVPPPSGSEAKYVKHPPQPFSAHDNEALENAWLCLASEKDRTHHKGSRTSQLISKTANQKGVSTASKLPTEDNKNRGLVRRTCNCSVSPDSNQDGLCECSCGTCQQAHAVASPLRDETTLSDTKVSRTAKSSNRVGGEAADDIGLHQDIVKQNQTVNSTVETVDSQNTRSDPYCDTPRHTALDPELSTCCSELEIGMQAEQDATSAGAEEANYTKSPAVDQDLAQLKSKAYKSFETHKQSKAHLVFEKDLSLAHGGHDSEANMESEDSREKTSAKSGKPAAPSEPYDSLGTNAAQGEESGITGFPFLKFPSPGDTPKSQSPNPSAHDHAESHNSADCHAVSQTEGSCGGAETDDQIDSETFHIHGCKAHKNTKEIKHVPVGVSRLHLVNLPALQMEPIYWSPVHDIAVVTRATWFYKDTMYPVEVAVANQLEMGYRELRPWSQTWNDELNSAIEVGAVGEEKISHQLWPNDGDQPNESDNASYHGLSTDPYCAAGCFPGDAAAEGLLDESKVDETLPNAKTTAKKYSNSQVIYIDSRNAFILKHNLRPSAYYGRRPLQKIKKGATVGIQVTRGFDWTAWEKLHPSKKIGIVNKAKENSPAPDDTDSNERIVCGACESRGNGPKVTDLILVIHGIGQKLSERVESFHFTHSINAFRRFVNLELGYESVRRVLRDDLGGVMVLPVNWRSTLSFEDGGPMKENDKDNANFEFSLKDITPDTIPAVRNLISDVMLDIPFYMSHHKPKMIQAVISEANRVYRLWCKNNPEFHRDGRVHIIAHSLGSAMAMEVLSRQPTSVPKIDLLGKRINTKHFDFNTTNLFFVGSPAAFFLLLDRGKLTPRRGQNKPGSEPGDDTREDITADAGSFGCLAVDNFYNIMHSNDPIAYRLNPTVDPQYAASLKIAYVPSATKGFFESIGNAMKSMTPGISSGQDLAVGQVPKPATVARLPSTLEMEVHDFTREEIAESKFCLLNDNGQVDWFLSSGGGPLEIQYLNMLSAHSSYWLSADFVRMVVTEVGRTPGQNHTLPNMRAFKTGHRS